MATLGFYPQSEQYFSICGYTRFDLGRHGHTAARPIGGLGRPRYRFPLGRFRRHESTYRIRKTSLDGGSSMRDVERVSERHREAVRAAVTLANAAMLMVLVGCGSTSAHSDFCAALREVTVNGVLILPSLAANDAPDRLPSQARDFSRSLDQLDQTAPPEIAPDVAQLTHAWREALAGRPRDPGEAGGRVENWANSNCEGAVPEGLPQPPPPGPEAPPAPPEADRRPAEPPNPRVHRGRG